MTGSVKAAGNYLIAQVTEIGQAKAALREGSPTVRAGTAEFTSQSACLSGTRWRLCSASSSAFLWDPGD